MKRSKVLTLGGSVLAVLCACAVLFLLWLKYDDDFQEFYELGQRRYIYDPQSILNEIDAGHGLEEVTTLPTLNPLTEPVTWEQSDFLRLALALVRSDWSEEWYLVDAGFGVLCDDVAAGPQKMDFRFHKKFVQAESGRGLGLLDMYVDARNGRVDWTAGAAVPPFGRYADRPELDLEELIEAQEALRIAEEEGGRAFREGLPEDTSGQCAVSGSLFRRNEWWGWQPAAWTIRYGEEGVYLPRWEICIDALSGELIDCK